VKWSKGQRAEKEVAVVEKTGSFLSGCWNGLGVGCGFIVFNLMWVAMLGFAGWYGYGSYALMRTGATVLGTVIENRVVSGDDGDSYKPIVEYTVDGETYTFESLNSSDPPAYRVGETVSLRYDPAKPQVARINSLFDLWLMPAILAPVALVLALVVNGGYFIAWRRGTLFESHGDSD
jgi:hypothetical protein